jgi:hypothetical protein
MNMNIIMNMKKTIIVSSAVVTTVLNGPSFADTCPVPNTSVSANIKAAVSMDSKTGLYKYSYVVGNDRDSKKDLNRFLVVTPMPVQNIEAPPHWDPKTGSEAGSAPSRINWSTSDIDPKLMNEPAPDDGSLAPAFYAIKPGASLKVFSFMSPNPPGPAKYMIQGDTTELPKATPTDEDDEPLPNCPGWDFTGPKYETMVNGITQGPMDPSVTSVAIRLRDGDNDSPYGAFHPLQPKGKLSVLILSTKTFDASTMDPATVQVGPGKASPLNSKIVTPKDRRAEESEDWENSVGFLKQKLDDKDKKQKKDLLLVFDVKAVGVRCVLDHALFLTGKTKDGKAIMGAKAIRVEGCNPRHSDKPHHTKK